MRVVVFGAGGRMGAHVLAGIEAASDLEVGAAVDHANHPRLGESVARGVQLTADLDAALASADVVIDFSLPEATLSLLEHAGRRGVPVVSATTGFSESQREQIRKASARMPIVLAPNFSIGIHVLVGLVEQAVRLLPDFEIEILELHHNAKVDAPSGTALRLAEAAAAARAQRLEDVAVYHREGHTGPRTPSEIGLQTLRAGSSTGEHTVFLAGPGERLELTHRSQSRDAFASGAIRAARWLVGKPAGLYGMEDVVAS